MTTHKEAFTVDSFLEVVFDNDFVASDKYAELLVAEIPKARQFDVLVEIYRRKNEGNGYYLAYIVKSLLKALNEQQLDDFMLIVSEELKTTRVDKMIRLNFQLLPPEYWLKISEISRMRIENKILNYIEKAKAFFDVNQGSVRTSNNEGALATWTTEFIKYFSDKYQLRYTLINKLEKDEDEALFVVAFFFYSMNYLIDYEWQAKSFVEAIVEAAKSDEVLRLLNNRSMYNFDSRWHPLIESQLKPILNESFFVLDEIPF